MIFNSSWEQCETNVYWAFGAHIHMVNKCQQECRLCGCLVVCLYLERMIIGSNPSQTNFFFVLFQNYSYKLLTVFKGVVLNPGAIILHNPFESIYFARTYLFQKAVQSLSHCSLTLSCLPTGYLRAKNTSSELQKIRKSCNHVFSYSFCTWTDSTHNALHFILNNFPSQKSFQIGPFCETVLPYKTEQWIYFLWNELLKLVT